MAHCKPVESGLRGMALDPLRNFQHECLNVPEWGDAQVIVRALSAGDWLDYRKRTTDLIAQARTAAGLPAVSNDDVSEPELDVPVAQLYALVLVRTLFDESGVRVFTDQDIDAVTAAFSPVHDRLVTRAFELSGVQVGSDAADPVQTAGNA